MSKDFDGIIVGGGLTGIALALALVQKGAKIALVDRAIPTQNPQDLDGRTLALAQGSRGILQTLGVWPLFEKEVHPIEEIRISQDPGRGFVHYKSKDVSPDPMGYLIPMFLLHSALERRLSEEPLISVYRPFHIKTLENMDDKVRLTSVDDEVLEAPLCFAADGRGSWIRETLGIPTKNWDYTQVGIVCSVTHENPHYQVAFEHFTPQGPVAFLPLGEKSSAVVWTQEPEAGAYLMSLNPEHFCQTLQTSFPFLGALTLEGKRWSYPLGGHLVNTPFKGRTLLIGDAAHGIHPVAGQGFNLGLRDVAWFMDQKDSFLKDDPAILRQRYRRHRRLDVWSMTALTHGLVKLFSNHSHSLMHLRALGMSLTNKLPFAKRLLTRHAMGTARTWL